MEMTFKFDDNAYFATNSIKPVTITQFDDDYFELFMSKGDANIEAPIKVGFETFEEARKWAEAYVGFYHSITSFAEGKKAFTWKFPQ